jgi:acetyl-CoA/propionyl-CoA carboxylase biotin carboxyl carrier protein
VTVFDRILIANRGEVAVRIMRTLRRMSIESIAVYSDADADALHVAVADEALRIGPAPARQSYLDIDRVIEAALASQAQAVHPGYGFLSENADFARACEAAGLVFIGPRPDVIAAMGDKIAAKQIAIAAGVPVVPGRHDAQMDDAALIAAIADIGFPALLKPAAGGGGKGMRVVREDTDVAAMIASARRESSAAFGDDRLLVERYVDRPRHVEVQVLGDATGRVIHLGERDCTLQRRHQKVIEEAPSLLPPQITTKLCESAVRLAASVGYTNAGTVEFVVPADGPADFAFLEMNTRLQVEHPVTEAVTGIDLVEQQVRIAAGEPLSLTQDDIVLAGHAVEARVYAEDPARGYLPTGGEIILWHAPDDVRVDSGVRTGSVVSGDYDPMIAKVIVHAPTRTQALAGLADALHSTVCLGVTTNIDDLAALVDEDRVVKGDVDTTVLDSREPYVGTLKASALAGAAPALLVHPADDLWSAGDAWRLGGPAWQRWDVGDHAVALRVTWSDVDVEIDDAAASPVAVDAAAFDGFRLWLHAAGEHHAPPARRPRDRCGSGRREDGVQGHWAARSPMPGAVIAVDVAVGDVVEAGAPLAVVEAMKMEHTLRAPGRGSVTRVAVSPGARVALDAVLVEIEIEGQEGS